MYRQIFIPSERNSHVAIPREWYGQEVEVIVSPVSEDTGEKQSLLAKRKELDETLDQYLFDFSGFKFNRDEANEYD